MQRSVDAAAADVQTSRVICAILSAPCLPAHAYSAQIKAQSHIIRVIIGDTENVGQPGLFFALSRMLVSLFWKRKKGGKVCQVKTRVGAVGDVSWMELLGVVNYTCCLRLIVMIMYSKSSAGMRRPLIAFVFRQIC